MYTVKDTLNPCLLTCRYLDSFLKFYKIIVRFVSPVE